jgi:predicted nucleic acid-binding protein
MAKLRVYVETSVWSFAFAEDAPDYTADTLLFFERCRQGAYEVFISDMVLREVEKADDALQNKLKGLIRDVQPRLFAVSAEAQRLASAFVSEGVVPPSKPEDATHVATAFQEELDVLVSWNFRHIANVRRAERFNAVAVLMGYYRPLRIVSPAEVLYDDEQAEA